MEHRDVIPSPDLAAMKEKLANEEIAIAGYVSSHNLSITLNLGGFEFELRGPTKDRFLALCEHLLQEHELKAFARDVDERNDT